MTLEDLRKEILKRLPSRSAKDKANVPASKDYTPEQLYQELKQEWFFHKSSWFMRGKKYDDGIGCNGKLCQDDCEFYPDHGRIEARNN